MTADFAEENSGNNIVVRDVVIQNELGLHVRPASVFVQLSGKFRCDITVKKDEQMVDGKSIMQMLMLGAAKGQKLTIEALGEDAHEAVEALETLVNNHFEER